MKELWINGMAMPSPISISQSLELIWSGNTGRSTGAKMIGDVVGEKVTLTVSWGPLSGREAALIQNNAKPGFFKVKCMDGKTGQAKEYTMYRGAMSVDAMGRLSDGAYYYRSLKLDLIEQ